MTAAGPPTLLYVGMRLALADSPQAYLILARGQPAPVQAFERSPYGRQQAFAVFMQWEPHAQPIGEPFGAPLNGTGPLGALVPSQGPMPYGAGYGLQPWGPAFVPRSPSG